MNSDKSKNLILKNQRFAPSCWKANYMVRSIILQNRIKIKNFEIGFSSQIFAEPFKSLKTLKVLNGPQTDAHQ